MNWFQQNRFPGTFPVTLVGATLLGGYFLLHEGGAAKAQEKRLGTTIKELNRLRTSIPFPNEQNLRDTRTQTDSYRASLQALERELKTRVLPEVPLQPSEFQAQLRRAVLAVSERARTSKVRLPENFNLGFDEYATSLPNRMAAPRLGQQLRAIAWLANTVVDAHVDSLDGLARSTLPEENAAATSLPGRNRAATPPKATRGNEKIVDSTSVRLAFSGSPVAARRVLNQTWSAQEQFYIIRTLQVKNQADKGPKRSTSVAPGAPLAPAVVAGTTRTTPETGITFIVGNEHVNVAAKIEIVRFNFLEKEGR